MSTFYIHDQQYEEKETIECSSYPSLGQLTLSQGQDSISLDRKQIEDLIRELKIDFNL